MIDAIITVTQLNEYVSGLFSRDALLKNLRVQGEISGFKRHVSGHLYFSLKDEGALVRCVMFKQAATGLSFLPRDGMQVNVDGYAALYTRDGQYQLYAQHMQQQGEGALHRRFLQLKAKLEAEGYFDIVRKRPLPLLPACVGIITSQTGAALQDILQVLRQRFARMNILVCPAQVQGEGAPRDIAAAINRMSKAGIADVLIVGRGGGSLEDLWAFNEPEVAKAVFESKIPVISAVGHETDFTICDFVADVRAPTPTAAAQLCVPEYAALVQRVDELFAVRLQRAARRGIERRKDRLRLLLQTRGFVAVEHSISSKQQILYSKLTCMAGAANSQLERRKTHLALLLSKLEALSPESLFRRGFAQVRDAQGNILASMGELSVDMPVRLGFQDGEALAIVHELKQYAQE